VAWTLSIEVMFYAFVPLGAWSLRKAFRRGPTLNELAAVVIALWVISTLWFIALALLATPEKLVAGEVADPIRVARWLLPAVLFNFCPGILIWLAETDEATTQMGPWAAYRRLRARPKIACAGALLLLAVVIVVRDQGGWWFTVATPLLPIPAGLLLCAALCPTAGPGRVRDFFALFGLISYGLYLWHAVVRSVLLEHGRGAVPWFDGGLAYWPLHALFLLALTVPLAAASWLMVERPILRRTTRWTRRRSRARPRLGRAVPEAD